MNKIAGRSLIALSALFLSLSAAAQTIAVVDMQSVFQQIPQRAEVQKRMQDEFSDRIAEVQKLQKELQDEGQKLQRDAQLMTEQQKIDGQRKLEGLQTQLQQQGKALDEDMRRRQNAEQQKLIVEVQAAVDAVAKAKGADLVLQRGAVLFVDEKLDLSKDVVAQMSKAN